MYIDGIDKFLFLVYSNRTSNCFVKLKGFRVNINVTVQTHPLILDPVCSFWICTSDRRSGSPVINKSLTWQTYDQWDYLINVRKYNGFKWSVPNLLRVCSQSILTGTLFLCFGFCVTYSSLSDCFKSQLQLKVAYVSIERTVCNCHPTLL